MGTSRRTTTDTILNAIAAVIIATCVIGWATILVLGNFVREAGPPVHATPTETTGPEPTAIVWVATVRQCADGWPSPSIGRRGACSHHGGVITIYQSSPGALRTFCPPAGHPDTLERARQLLTLDNTVDCDFGQTPAPQPTRSDNWAVTAPE
ncbi:hypothetical protein ABT169_16210 [Streptomyces sp. NPDC001616]|uniref:hypothetical protein n=1 Tax=Streptomyces sp. NPDC001616 TaxID=3156648 RepID=UPI00331A5C30